MKIKGVLLDLDDTLLDTNMDRFLPQYFQALGNKMQSFLPPDKMIDIILESTQMMMRDQNPNHSNQAVFDSNFFPKINHPDEEIKSAILNFYEYDFPILQKYTKRIPIATDFVEKIISSGYKVAVATNPLFPRRAIEHRINWAGLSHIPFDLITTYENSHFCKPNPLYYQEILDKLDLQPSETIMIGDDLINDIEPAQHIGITTFLINNKHDGDELSGDLKECIEWISNLENSN